MDKKRNELLEVTFELALDIVQYCELLEEKKKFVIARQLLKAGTSVGANAQESQGAESRADFVHKLKIAYKESEETEYWLRLCEFSKNYPSPPQTIKNKLESSKKLLGKIIGSAKRNQL